MLGARSCIETFTEDYNSSVRIREPPAASGDSYRSAGSLACLGEAQVRGRGSWYGVVAFCSVPWPCWAQGDSQPSAESTVHWRVGRTGVVTRRKQELG